MTSSATLDAGRPVAVSCAGGLSRQFRVQFRSAYRDGWQRYACYQDEAAAVDCADALQRQGYLTRVIRYGITPVAA